MSKSNGKVIAFLGSMKASKSSALFEQIDRAKYRKKSVCLVRPINDTRLFVSRKELTDVDTFVCNKLSEINLNAYDIVCVDEGQFIQDIGQDSNLLANNGKEVYIAALNGDSDMKPWDNISSLIPYCDNIFRQSAVCDDCGDEYKATFSYFVGKKDSQITIGDNQYLALCRDCWTTRHQQ
jgi:thymidine kinase